MGLSQRLEGVVLPSEIPIPGVPLLLALVAMLCSSSSCLVRGAPGCLSLLPAGRLPASSAVTRMKTSQQARPLPQTRPFLRVRSGPPGLPAFSVDPALAAVPLGPAPRPSPPPRAAGADQAADVQGPSPASRATAPGLA